MTTETPDPVDVHIGTEIAARRKLLGHTQAGLATAIGVTFQQVQKYERGVNRVSAARLVRIGAFLGSAPGSFLPPPEGVSDDDVSNAARLALDILNAGGMAVVKDFLTLDHGRREIVRQTARLLTREIVQVDDLAGSSTVLAAPVKRP